MLNKEFDANVLSKFLKCDVNSLWDKDVPGYIFEDEGEEDEEDEQDEDEHEEDEDEDDIRRLIHKSDITFEDIAGLDIAKNDMKYAFATSLVKAPKGVIIPQIRNILLYGPAGCGKTLIAAASSNCLGVELYSVKISDILSQWYGKTSKFINSLYREARKHRSIIFLDEFDAIASDRDTTNSSADQKLVASLLMELDGLNEKNATNNVMTIAATNKPWAIDFAILSRFEKQIYIPLPDDETRKKMLHLQLTSRGYEFNFRPSYFVEHTVGLSNREISHLLKIMIEAMIYEANPNMYNIPMHELPEYELKIIPLTKNHLVNACKRIRINTNQNIIQEFELWRSEQQQ